MDKTVDGNMTIIPRFGIEEASGDRSIDDKDDPPNGNSINIADFVDIRFVPIMPPQETALEKEISRSLNSAGQNSLANKVLIGDIENTKPYHTTEETLPILPLTEETLPILPLTEETLPILPLIEERTTQPVKLSKAFKQMFLQKPVTESKEPEDLETLSPASSVRNKPVVGTKSSTTKGGRLPWINPEWIPS